MKIAKSILVVLFISTLLIGCKKDEVNAKTVTFHIEGMTCAMGCAKTIEKKLTNTEGVQKATIDFDKKEGTVSFDPSVLTKEDISKSVEATGDGKTYKVSDAKTETKN